MEQSRQIWARSAASSPHNFSGRIIKGYLCHASVVWGILRRQKMYLNIELNYYETYRNRKRSSEKSRDERDAF